MQFTNLQQGIITPGLKESREFYTKILGFQVKFETEWYLLLCLPENPEFELAFLLPDQEQVRKSYFQKPYNGQGTWLILESLDAEKDYAEMLGRNAPIDLPLTEESWGDVHFTLTDPNGIGIDIVQKKEAAAFA